MAHTRKKGKEPKVAHKKVAHKKDNDNLEKLTKAGILPTRHELAPQDQEVIKSLTREEVGHWVRIKEKLDKAGAREQECKFFI